MPDYSFMRTGFSLAAPAQEPQWSQEDWVVAQAALLIFTEDSMVMAKQYASMRGHPVATMEDIVHCLKAKTREGLATSPNMLARMQEYRQMLLEAPLEPEPEPEQRGRGEEAAASASGGDEAGSESDPGEDHEYCRQAESLLRQMDPEVTQAYGFDRGNLVARVQDLVESWDRWEPQTDVERILKSAVNHTHESFAG